MIWYETAWAWTQDNSTIVIIAILVIGYFSFKKVIEYSKKRKAEDKFEQYPKSTNPNLPPPTFDDIDFDKDILESEFMEKNNVNHLITERNQLVEEIDKRKLEYAKAKDTRERSLIVMRRLAKYVPQLANQYKVLDQQIKELEKRK